jgi:hypothetical protein
MTSTTLMQPLTMLDGSGSGTSGGAGRGDNGGDGSDSSQGSKETGVRFTVAASDERASVTESRGTDTISVVLRCSANGQCSNLLVLCRHWPALPL